MATVNTYVYIDTLVNGAIQRAGSLFDPSSLTASAGVVNQLELVLSGAATSTIFAASSPATIIYCKSDVAGTYLIQGSDEASNSAITVPAGFPLVISGQTKDANATIAGRAAASTETVTAIYFVHAGSGVMHVSAVR